MAPQMLSSYSRLRPLSVDIDHDTCHMWTQMSESLGPPGEEAVIELSSGGQIKDLIQGGLTGNDQGLCFSHIHTRSDVSPPGWLTPSGESLLVIARTTSLSKFGSGCEISAYCYHYPADLNGKPSYMIAEVPPSQVACRLTD